MKYDVPGGGDQSTAVASFAIAPFKNDGGIGLFMTVKFQPLYSCVPRQYWSIRHFQTLRNAATVRALRRGRLIDIVAKATVPDLESSTLDLQPIMLSACPWQRLLEDTGRPDEIRFKTKTTRLPLDRM
jgi:hypothetical protein